jgi:hypothetical protein
MTQEGNRDRVMAEVTSFHLMRLANEHGCNFSREQAINAFDSVGCPNLITPWLSAFLITSSVARKSGLSCLIVSSVPAYRH